LEEGDGVWRVRKSLGFVALVVVVLEEKEDKPDKEDKCELKELTLDGSALFPLPLLFELFPVDEEEVLSANG
jgi:hypothetical protein